MGGRFLLLCRYRVGFFTSWGLLTEGVYSSDVNNDWTRKDMFPHLNMTCKRCGWQGYGVFIVIWLFFIPMIIFVVAYWKILAVVRRQARVAAERTGIQCSTLSKEPVAGTSRGKSDTTNPGKTNDEGVDKAGSRRVKGQTGSNSLSKTQVNVVRTMVYITVCFTLCWMPLYGIFLYKRLFLAVRHIKIFISKNKHR